MTAIKRDYGKFEKEKYRNSQCGTLLVGLKNKTKHRVSAC